MEGPQVNSNCVSFAGVPLLTDTSCFFSETFTFCVLNVMSSIYGGVKTSIQVGLVQGGLVGK